MNARALEGRIAARASDFDLAALLALLRRLGYRDVRLRASSAGGSQPTMVRAAGFQPPGGDPAEATVTITVHQGLLSGRSPLPSYLLDLCRTQRGEPLAAVLRWLDEELLAERAAARCPERDARVFPEPGRTRRSLARLGAPTSPAALHRLFEAVFPELGVSARRALVPRRLPAPPPRLGHAVLSGAALGGEAELSVEGALVRLYAEGAFSPAGAPWIEEAPRRVAEDIGPLLRGSGAAVAVALVLLDGRAVAALREGSFLGYDPLPGGGGRPQVVPIALQWDP